MWFEAVYNLLTSDLQEISTHLLSLIDEFLDYFLLLAQAPLPVSQLSAVLLQLVKFALDEQVRFPMKLEAIRTFNSIVESLSRDQRRLIQNDQNQTQILPQVAAAVLTVGDYELQVSLSEALCRLTPRRDRQQRAYQWFCSCDLSSAFCDIRDSDFEVDSRRFLNLVNRHHGDQRRVYTFPCLRAFLNSTQLFRPRDDKLQEFWIDFNLGSECLSFFIDEPQGFLWGSIHLRKEEVDHYSLMVKHDATLRHILSGCKIGLAQGRYTWRHNQVLKILASTLEDKRAATNSLSASAPNQQQTMTCVREGAKVTRSCSTPSERGQLRLARDWKMLADVGRQLMFPKEIATTTLRPDLVLWSPSLKKVYIVELTVPWEDARLKPAFSHQSCIGSSRKKQPVALYEEERSQLGPKVANQKVCEIVLTIRLNKPIVHNNSKGQRVELSFNCDLHKELEEVAGRVFQKVQSSPCVAEVGGTVQGSLSADQGHTWSYGRKKPKNKSQLKVLPLSSPSSEDDASVSKAVSRSRAEILFDLIRSSTPTFESTCTAAPQLPPDIPGDFSAAETRSSESTPSLSHDPEGAEPQASPEPMLEFGGGGSSSQPETFPGCQQDMKRKREAPDSGYMSDQTEGKPAVKQKVELQPEGEESNSELTGCSSEEAGPAPVEEQLSEDPWSGQNQTLAEQRAQLVSHLKFDITAAFRTFRQQLDEHFTGCLQKVEADVLALVKECQQHVSSLFTAVHQHRLLLLQRFETSVTEQLKQLEDNCTNLNSINAQILVLPPPKYY
ncbi:synaptonemal complex protein 2-like [Cololabis saira]|uniref:synaptonemal complex protein 2-like n=1 Tax=Cololabis saira TaxID=129043 RepID=UPI002AD33067|nr:synaptonemal complex protein 2-like [Cololabis saira]